MAYKIIDINNKSIATFIEKHRPKVEMRDKIDLGYSYDNGVAELFEKRPSFLDKTTVIQSSFAKIKFVKTQQVWKLYWMRASGKWQSYEPLPESKFIAEILNTIEADQFGCFFG